MAYPVAIHDNQKSEIMLLCSSEQWDQLLSGEFTLVVSKEGGERFPILEPYKHLVAASSNFSQDSLTYKQVPDPDLMDVPPRYQRIVRVQKRKSQKKDPSSLGAFDAKQLIDLYNEFAERNGWQKNRALGIKLRRYLVPALKQFPERHQWETVLRGWEAHPFFSGKTGEYTRVKILTMLFKNRYEEFHEDGLALGESPTGKTQKFLQELDVAEEEARKAFLEMAAKNRAEKC